MYFYICLCFLCIVICMHSFHSAHIFKVCNSVKWPTHSIFNYGHIVKLYNHFIYNPLNSYIYIHWILDFKYIYILLLLHLIGNQAITGWPPSTISTIQAVVESWQAGNLGFTKQFANTVKHATHKTNRHINRATHNIQGYNITLTISQVQEAIKQSKNFNSQGPDKLNIRHIKHIGPLGLAFLTSMFNSALNKKHNTSHMEVG